jgi:hypothetical protein
MAIGAAATADEPAPVLSPAILQSLRSAGLGRTPAAAYVMAPGVSQPDSLPHTPYLSNGQVDYRPTRNTVLAANSGGRLARDEFASAPPSGMMNLRIGLGSARPIEYSS